ncbi:hypothetical protein B0H34DRAFT_801662 [Crassisporium funariophilum]|nr:hypothetical protein B0H34DRAFT_801662 [Crassisporium funariophilum]
MNDFIPLTRPLNSQVSIDPTAKNCPSEGFNFPTFRQLNKRSRVHLSQPLNPEPSTSYHLFATANTKGWFVAVRAGPSTSELILSTLEDLRSAFVAAENGSDELFVPKRILPLPGKCNMVAFASADTRLLVGLEQGTIAVYDTAVLFTSGSDETQPMKTTQIQSRAFRQIAPNPGTEQNLGDLVAVVADGKVQLLNMQLEPQGGWVASDIMTQPIAVAWSPKGKHIAIGLQTGDILTFSLANNSTPHKHIPPTADAILVSLNWLGPGHTFRTSYAAQGGAAAKQHIISLDVKSSLATYVSPDHPFPSFDRSHQNAYTLTFPRWDEDPASSDGSKSLTIVGDVSSVDIEVLGNVGNQWHRHSQENPVTLPLDKSLDDTMMLALEADLTDSSSASPVVYAYLNDGTVQGWQLEHSKPYLGIVSAVGLGPNFSQTSALSQESGPKDSDMGDQASMTASSEFGQQAHPGTKFGDTGFGQQSTSPFGQQQGGAFGQPAFGQQPQGSSPFGQPSSQGASAFGQPSFGQPSTFGSSPAFPSSTSNVFGQTNQSSTTSSAGFGAFSGASGAFGTGSSGAFGTSSNAFSNLGSGTPSVFGQGSFGATRDTAPGSTPPSMTREASMSDSTPGFGGLGLGSAHTSDSNAVNSMFGSFTTVRASDQSETPLTSAFGGGLVKPASGFGAFNNLKTSNNFEMNKPAANAFSTPAQPSSAFGQSGFASPAFGKSSFGQPAFGKPSLGSTPGSSTSGGFGAFANTPTTLGSTTQSATTSAFGGNIKPPSSSAGGFSAFASNPVTLASALGPSVAPESKTTSETGGGFGSFASGAPTTFGSALAATAAPESKSGSGFGGFASNGPSPFGGVQRTADGSEATATHSILGSPSAFSTTKTTLGETPVTKSPFGGASTSAGGITTPGSSPKTSFAYSPPSSPEPSGNAKSPSPFGSNSALATPPPASSSGAFGNLQSSPSPFKPAPGFGAFGSGQTPKSSPFIKKAEETPPPSSFFGNVSPSPLGSTTPASEPKFGAPTALGAVKSAFAPISPPSPTPVKTPTTGGFGAFSGSPTGFSAFAGPKKSFSDLLKSGDSESKDPVKPSTQVFATPTRETPENKASPKARTSVFGTSLSASGGAKEADANADRPQHSVPVFSAFPLIAKENEVETKADNGENKNLKGKESEESSKKPLVNESSYGTISASSAASSFVDVKEEGSDQDAENDDDARSFLSDNFSDGSYQDDQSSDEESEEDSAEEQELPEDRGSTSPEPATVPLPGSRSPSATPQPEVPRIEVSPSPPAEETKPSPISDLSPARESSTTPPGTPVKETKSLFGSSPSPSASNTASGATPFGLGLGRPSTRPTRSSPLANAVSVENEEDEDDKSKRTLPSAVPPKAVFGMLPVKPDDSKATESSSETPTLSEKRPKTPPLLSTLSGTSATPPTPFFAPPAPKPSISSESLFGKTNAPSALPFSFQKTPLASSPQGISVKPTEDVAPTFFSTPPKPDLQRASTAPAPPLRNFFAASPAAAPASTPPTPAFNISSFNFKGPSGASQPPAVGLDFFATKPSVSPGTPTSSFFAPPGAQPSTMFGGTKSTTTQAPQSVFGSSPKFAPPHAPGMPALAPVKPATAMPPPVVPTPDAVLEEGMQKECMYLVNTTNKELEEIGRMAGPAKKKLLECSYSFGGSRNKADLADPSKWNLVDMKQFGHVLQQYQGDLEYLSAQRDTTKQALREIQSNMLKAGTRREEIARFNKAKNDEEFARMLRVRTLGPEHSETQTQLRKNIRTIRDRVQKLETHLQEKKKKLAQSTSGKPGFRAPSLDTINRTYRNIDIAIQQQGDEISRLAGRISKLNVKDINESPSSPRDSRLPDAGARRPFNVTPNVAVTTAAALNAERSAQRLKRALLAVRKEPLLNIKAAVAPKAPLAFKTPQKPSTSTSGFAFQTTPWTGSLFGPPELAEPTSLPDWTLPEDNFNPNATPLPQGRRGGKEQRKHPSVPLKRSGGLPATAPMPSPAAPSFDWGPLPSFPASGASSATLPKSFVPLSAFSAAKK